MLCYTYDTAAPDIRLSAAVNFHCMCGGMGDEGAWKRLGGRRGGSTRSVHVPVLSECKRRFLEFRCLFDTRSIPIAQLSIPSYELANELSVCARFHKFSTLSRTQSFQYRPYIAVPMFKLSIYIFIVSVPFHYPFSKL